jgi:hypothetical protein
MHVSSCENSQSARTKMLHIVVRPGSSVNHQYLRRFKYDIIIILTHNTQLRLLSVKTDCLFAYLAREKIKAIIHLLSIIPKRLNNFANLFFQRSFLPIFLDSSASCQLHSKLFYLKRIIII